MNSGRWISIDGVEAAGKTTLARELNRIASDAVVVHEFNDDPVGTFLAAMVQTDPHVFSRSRVGQSLLFLGEFWQRYDITIRPAIEDGKLVLSDRGLLSKYVYQLVVMEPAIGERAARSLLDAAFAPMTFPDLTVVLSAPIEVIERRLIERDGPVSERRRAFIKRADDIFGSAHAGQSEGKILRFDTSCDTPAAIAHAIHSLVWSDERRQTSSH